MLLSFLLSFVACFFLWISAETATSSLGKIPYNSLIALIYKEWKRVLCPWEITFVITWLTLWEGFFAAISKEVITQLDSAYHLTHLFGALCKTLLIFVFLYQLDAKAQDHIGTTKSEVGNQNADSRWKGAVTSCAGSVRNLIFDAEHWSKFLFLFSGLRLYHLPNLTCLLSEVQINCTCGDCFHYNDDICLSGAALKPTAHFYTTKQLKDVLC